MGKFTNRSISLATIIILFFCCQSLAFGDGEEDCFDLLYRFLHSKKLDSPQIPGLARTQVLSHLKAYQARPIATTRYLPADEVMRIRKFNLTRVSVLVDDFGRPVLDALIDFYSSREMEPSIRSTALEFINHLGQKAGELWPTLYSEFKTRVEDLRFVFLDPESTPGSRQLRDKILALNGLSDTLFSIGRSTTQEFQTCVDELVELIDLAINSSANATPSERAEIAVLISKSLQALVRNGGTAGDWSAREILSQIRAQDTSQTGRVWVSYLVRITEVLTDLNRVRDPWVTEFILPALSLVNNELSSNYLSNPHLKEITATRKNWSTLQLAVLQLEIRDQVAVTTLEKELATLLTDTERMPLTNWDVSQFKAMFELGAELEIETLPLGIENAYLLVLHKFVTDIRHSLSEEAKSSPLSFVALASLQRSFADLAMSLNRMNLTQTDSFITLFKDSRTIPYMDSSSGWDHYLPAPSEIIYNLISKLALKKASQDFPKH